MASGITPVTTYVGTPSPEILYFTEGGEGRLKMSVESDGIRYGIEVRRLWTGKARINYQLSTSTQVFGFGVNFATGDEWVDDVASITTQSNQTIRFGYSDTTSLPSVTQDIQLTVIQETTYNVTNELTFIANGSTVKTHTLTGTYETSPSTVTMSQTVFPTVEIQGYRLTGWDVSDGTTTTRVSGLEDVSLTAGVDITFTAVLEKLSNIYVYNGEEWLAGMIYIYNGEEWMEGEPYIYDGTEWKKGI